MTSTRVAVIQAAPVYLDPEGGVEKARRLVAQAASKGAALIAFGECWLPGYPVHALNNTNTPLWWGFAAEYLEAAVEVPGPITDALCQIADEHAVDIVIGVAERDAITRGSIYSTQLVISAEGQVIGRHRKLRPSLNERAVFADGDASGLQVFQRQYGVVSGLNGCEHQMVLPTYALAEQGTQFHIASWPGGEAPVPPAPMALLSRQHLLSRAFAAQTGAYVLCASGLLSADLLPPQYRDLLPEPLTGNSAIIDPRGEFCAGPVEGETIVYSNCSNAMIRTAKVAFDCTGHSGRPDQLEFRNHGAPPPEGEDGGFEGVNGPGEGGETQPELEAGGSGEMHRPGGPGWQTAGGRREPRRIS